MRSLQQIPASDAQVSLPTFAIGKGDYGSTEMSVHAVEGPW
jgi:hypothetical protein